MEYSVSFAACQANEAADRCFGKGICEHGRIRAGQVVISRASPFSICDFKFLHPGGECSGLYAEDRGCPIGSVNLALRLPKSFENIFPLAPLLPK